MAKTIENTPTEWDELADALESEADLLNTHTSDVAYGARLALRAAARAARKLGHIKRAGSTAD